MTRTPESLSAKIIRFLVRYYVGREMINMPKLPVILDLETKEKFKTVNHDRKKLGVSLAGVYDYKTGETKVFLENELGGLFKILENCSYVIGFNIRHFDIPVLQAYYPGDFSRLYFFDILEDIKDRVGKRLALNDLLFATLNKRKSGHGLMALDYYKEGKMDELKKYCMDDVMLTKELFDFGVQNGHVFYLNEVKKVQVGVDWKKYLTAPKNQSTHLTLPF